MANTKVTGDLIASGTITAANLVSGTLDSILGTYLSTNSYATQSYVTTAVSNLIDAAPASLDTLNELAAALNDDANFATTVTNALATKLNLSGGNITGNLSVDTDTFYVDSSNNRVGIGIGSPTTALDVRSGDTSTQITIGASNGGTYGRLYADNDGDLILGADAGDNAANSYMGFEVDGSERMRIDSSGNVGIGTSSPAARIDYGSATGEAFYLHNGSGDVYGIDMAVYDGDGFSTNIFSGGGGKIKLRTRSAGANPLTTKMTIDSSGNVGIGTSSPARLLDVQGSGGVARFASTNGNANQIVFSNAANAADQFLVGSPSANALQFSNSIGIERMRITSGGGVAIGTTSQSFSAPLTVSGAVSSGAPNFGIVTNIYNASSTSTSKAANAILRVASQGSGSDTHCVFTDNVSNNYYFGGNNSGAYVMTNSNGVRLSNGGTSWASDSDERIKDIIEPITEGLTKVSTLRAVIGKYKTDDKDKRRVFLIAQDVQAVLPEAVFENEGALMLQYTDIIPLIVSSIKELKDIVDQQQIEIDNLKAQLNG